MWISVQNRPTWLQFANEPSCIGWQEVRVGSHQALATEEIGRRGAVADAMEEALLSDELATAPAACKTTFHLPGN